jgi:hypothetical protein
LGRVFARRVFVSDNARAERLDPAERFAMNDVEAFAFVGQLAAAGVNDGAQPRDLRRRDGESSRL